MADPAVVKVIVDRLSPPPGSPGGGATITWRQAYEMRVRNALDAGLSGDDIVAVASKATAGLPTIGALDSRIKEHKDWLKWTKQQSADAAATAKAFPSQAAASSAQAGAPTTQPAGPTDAPLGLDDWIPVPGRPNVWADPRTGNTFDASTGQLTKFKEGDGAGDTASAAASRFATSESARQFNQRRLDEISRFAVTDQQAEQSRRDTLARNTVTDQQWNSAYNEGVRQFGVTADRNAFESDRSYQQAADQFATNFAQTQANIEYEAASNKTRFGMEAEQFAATQATADRQAALAEQENRQEILRRPSDFVNYAFQSRGKVAPTERITHADLINAASAAAAERQAASNAAVSRLRDLAANAPTPRLVAPTLSPRLAAPVVQPPAYAGSPVITAQQRLDMGQIPTAADPGFENRPATPEESARYFNAQLGIPDWAKTPRMSDGGMTRAPMLRVGEEPSGKPNDTEETIVNPTNAPLGVIKNPATVAQEDPVQKKRMASAAAIGRMMQHVEDPALQHALVDEAAKMKAGGQGGMPRFALGTGQTLEDLARAGQPVSQEDILSAAQQFAPPAITDLTSGRRISRFTPAFPSLTPRKVSMLTPSERTAADSYFGVVGNTTVADELAGIQSTFGPSVGRARSRFVSY